MVGALTEFTTLELVEQSPKSLSDAELGEVEAIALATSLRFDVTFPSPLNNRQYVVRARNWVGHFPVSDRLVVHVAPKVPVSRIFAMLEVAFGLKSFGFVDGDVDVASIDDLIEHLTMILAQRTLARVRRGIYKAYVSREEQLGVVRGRINVRKALQATQRGIVKVDCEFEELTSDLADNRILLWTLHLASRAVKRAEVRALSGRAHRALLGEVQLAPASAAECVGRVYQRLNEDYRPLHALCRLILSGVGPDIGLGSNTVLPFSLNMASLFEEFVATWLRDNTEDMFTVQSKYNVSLQSNLALSFEMDLVIRDPATNAPIAVLDTKYKDVTEPSAADLSQIVSYAVELGVKKAFLVYPKPMPRPFCLITGGIEVMPLWFDIGTDQASAGQTFLSRLLGGLAEDRQATPNYERVPKSSVQRLDSID